MRWDRGLVDLQGCSGDGACVFCAFLRFLGRFGVVDLSGFKTEIRRFKRNPAFQEKSYVSGGILRFGRNPTFQEKYYVSGEILRFGRNPTFREKSYVSGEILRFMRNTTFQEKS